jgi:hypothetical protein
MNNKKDYRIASDHPDLILLCKLTNTSPDDLRGSFHGGLTPDESYESNYMKVHFLRYWTKEDVENLDNQFAQANEQTTEYEFILDDLTDYEVEWDDDRSWPAAFGIKAIKKIVNNL